MNQLTVMLNGNGPNGPHQQQSAGAGQQQQQGHQQQTQQFFTFAGQPQGLTLDGQHHQQQHQPQMVTFQSQGQAGTMMASLSGSQAYSTGAQAGMTQQTPTGTIQYIITQPQQPQQTMLAAAPTQSQFGIVQNLLSAPGMGGSMIQTMNQQPTLTSNGTIQMAPTVMAPNGTFMNQPNFLMTTANHQPTFQMIQQNPQLQFHQQSQQQQHQFQLQAPAGSLNNSAIAFNGGSQIVNGPNGQQFVITNPTMGNVGLMNQPAAVSQQPIYQFVLPNGQLIQTMPQQQQLQQAPTINATTNLISPQTLMAPNGTAIQTQQSAAITVPLQAQNQTGNQMMNFITTGPGGGLTLATGHPQTFITQSNQQHQTMNSTHHQSPNMQQQLQNGHLMITTGPSPGGQPLILNTSPQIHQHHQTLSNGTNNTNQQQQQTLLIPATSSASTNHHQQQQHQQTNNINNNNQTATTAMVVLTQGNNNSVIPNSVLDQKSIQQQCISSPVQQTVLLLTSPKMNHHSPSQTTTRKVPTVQTPVNHIASDISGKSKVSNGDKISPKISFSSMSKAKPVPCDQATQCDDHPQIHKILEEHTAVNQEGEEESQSSQVSQQTNEAPSSEQENSPTQENPATVERPSRPSSTSSCGSLKIAEEEEEGCEEGETNSPERAEQDNDTENTENDAYSSTATEVDNGSQCSVNDEGNGPQSCATSDQEGASVEEKTVAATAEENSNSNSTAKKRSKQEEDKEGYQSSYGSCHFTDTEDEEEEEMELTTIGAESAIDAGQEIKLVRKNGLTKAAFDLINNRLLGSDCGEDQTTNDSCAGDQEEEEEETEKQGQAQEEEETSRDSNGAFAMQTPSPSGSTASSAQMEPESTTNNCWAAAKEKTITNLRDRRFYNGIDLEPIRLFAREFKVFRQARGLTQSQVCQDLAFKTDGQSYSQSAICRFEKLDITPKSAVKIKPVLESWLRTSMEKYPSSKQHPGFESSLVETIKERTAAAAAQQFASLVNNSGSLEGQRSAGLQGHKRDDESITSFISSGTQSGGILLECNGKKRKKRTSFTLDQLEALNHFFEKTPKPSSEEMTEIAKILCAHDPKINRDVVRVWFCNKRQALKAKRPYMEGDSPISTPPPSLLPTIIEQSQQRPSFNNGAHLNNLTSQPLGPIDQNLTTKLLNLTTTNTNGNINTNHHLQLTSNTSTTLPHFAFPSPVSAIPLALSNPPSGINSKNGGSMNSSLIRTSMQTLSGANSALTLAAHPQLNSIRTPIMTTFTATTLNNNNCNSSKISPVVTTAFKIERTE